MARSHAGTALVHAVTGYHSRVAYAEVHADETTVTAIAVLQRTTGWFAARGVPVERVLSDNGSAYLSRAWLAACQELATRRISTRPRRPKTNGKIGRFYRTLADGSAYGRFYASESARRAARQP